MTREPIPNSIIEGDCLEVMRQWPDACVDHCIADPPFGIASGGGRRGKRGLGWAFSSHVTMDEAWDRFSKDEFFQFNVAWLSEVCRVVKPNGNILVFGTFHNIYQLGFILQNVLDRRVLNSIVWFKPNAQPNITARTLTESTEQIIWAVNNPSAKAKNWVFNYWKAKGMTGGTQMRNLWFPDKDVWEVPVVPRRETKCGKHPAQKPLELTNRLVSIATEPGDLVLDPFAGAGGTALSALRGRRAYVLIESDPKYVCVAHSRVTDFMDSKYMRFLQKEGGMSLTEQELSMLTEIPVPQADNLDIVFDVPRMVRDGHDTRSKVAEQIRYVGRQGPYYADAAMALGLVQVEGSLGKGPQRLAPTALGEEYLASSESQRPALRRGIVLNAPIMKYVSAELGLTRNGDPALYPPAAELLSRDAVASVLERLPSDLAKDTAFRRAQTLCGWLERI